MGNVLGRESGLIRPAGDASDQSSQRGEKQKNYLRGSDAFNEATSYMFDCDPLHNVSMDLTEREGMRIALL